MSEQVLDIKGSVRLLRRFWRAVAIFVLAGILAAVGYEVLTPTRYQATALVLLPSSGAGTPLTQAARNTVTTDAGIATSAAVLVPAGRRVSPSLTLSTLERRVGAGPDTDGLLEISASGVSPKGAEALANAVAEQLVTFLTTGGVAASSHAVAGLQSEQSQVTSQLAVVQRELAGAEGRLSTEAPTSPQGKRDAALVATLTSEQSNFAVEINSLKNQIAQAEVEQVALNQGTEVVQRATTATARSAASVVLPLGLGALAGLILGGVVVLGWRWKDPRLWDRDALAQALGAPVVLSLDVPVRRSSKQWADLLRRYQPTASERWAVGRALRELSNGQPGGTRLVVLAFADDLAGVSEALHALVVAASSGLETVVSVVARAPQVVSLSATCARIEAEGSVARPCLTVRAGAGAAGDASRPPDLTAVVFIVERRQPKLAEVDRRAATTVLSVSAGSSSADDLAQLAIGAADSGEPIRALFVANPAPDDNSVGRLPIAGWAGRMLPPLESMTSPRRLAMGAEKVGTAPTSGNGPSPRRRMGRGGDNRDA